MFAAVVMLVAAVRNRWHWAVPLTLAIGLAALLAITPDGHTITHSFVTFAQALGDAR